jgi:hypothetical protein
MKTRGQRGAACPHDRMERISDEDVRREAKRAPRIRTRRRCGCLGCPTRCPPVPTTLALAPSEASGGGALQRPRRGSARCTPCALRSGRGAGARLPTRACPAIRSWTWALRSA